MSKGTQQAIFILLLLTSIVLFVPIQISQPTRLSLATPSGSSTFHGAQQWLIFDTSGRLVEQHHSDRVTISLVIAQQPPTVDAGNKGYIQVYEWFENDAAIAGHVPTNLLDYGSYDVIVFTRKLTARVLINGANYASADYIPWALENDITGFIANGYANVLRDGSSVSFITGDPAGVRRGALIYFLLSPNITPSDCNKKPSACINLVSLVSKGEDFTITLEITEDWKDYETTYDPFHQQQCDFRLLLAELYCVQELDEATVTDKYSMQLVEFGYFSTLPNGQTTFIQTKYRTDLTTVTIHIVTTVIGGTTKLIIEEKHQTTTIVNTATLTGPPTGETDFCSVLPFLCESTAGIPNWLLAVAMIFLLIALFRGSGRGSGSQVVIVHE